MASHTRVETDIHVRWSWERNVVERLGGNPIIEGCLVLDLTETEIPEVFEGQVIVQARGLGLALTTRYVDLRYGLPAQTLAELPVPVLDRFTRDHGEPEKPGKRRPVCVKGTRFDRPEVLP